MNMTIMTRSWTEIAFNIQVFMIHERCRDEQKVQAMPAEDLYAKWRQENGPLVKDVDLALWCVDFIQRMKRLSINQLKQTADWDGLTY